MKSFGLTARLGAGVAAEIYLNGALLSEKAPGQMTSQSLAMQHDVLPGVNRLLALATGAGVPPHAPARPIPDANPDDFFLELELDTESVRDLGDSYEVTTDPVDERSWRPAEDGGPVALPHRISLDFHAPEGMRPPVWARASAVQPESVRGLVAAELQSLRRLVEAREFQLFQARMRIRNEDMARAYPLSGSASERAARDVAILEERIGEARPQVPPIDHGALAIRTFADGRIIDVRASDGKPPLRVMQQGQQPVYLSVSFAMIGGELVAVR